VGDVKIRYYVTRENNAAGRRWGYWAPCLARRNAKTGNIEPTLMAALGFELVDCGPDGPLAWATAKSWNDRWDVARAQHERGELVERPAAIERSFPPGSLGEAFGRFRSTETWKKKKPRTREDWLRGWKLIEPTFGDVDPKTVALEHVDSWYAALLETKGVRESHRAMKIWRALWRIVATMRTAGGGKYCERDHDPSLGIRRETPRPRDAIWYEGEAVLLVKGAWRQGYLGLAACLAVAWDTSFSPVDVRTLTLAQLFDDAGGQVFQRSRAKTGKATIGTLSKRAQWVLNAYLATLPKGLHPSAPIFHTRGYVPSARGGKPRPPVPYTADTLGDDFRDVRSVVFPGDRRQLLDFRRSGTVEAKAGGATRDMLKDKLGNSIDSNAMLDATYLPPNATVVRLVDETRRLGRVRLRGNSGDRKT
jgi:hypothetical protein